MKISAEQLFDLDPNHLKFVSGHQKAVGTKVVPPEQCQAGSTVFVSTIEQYQMAHDKNAGIIIALKKALPSAVQVKSSQAVFETTAIPLAMALILKLFDQKIERFPAGINEKASIAATAKLGKNVRVGAFSVIGENVQIGDNSIIGPHCVIEKNSVLGVSTLLHSFVFVGANSEVGSYCEIHPHVTLGSDGFGFVPRDKQAPLKISQLGKVVIEDHVEIGANCAIDRGALTETRIGHSTKFDNLCHVAHNCKIGPNCLIAAGFMIAGSSEIGANFMCGGDVVVSDHVKITDNVMLGGRATVTKDITQPGAYTGYPLVPLKEGLKYIASLPSVPELRKQVSEIQERLEKMHQLFQK